MDINYQREYLEEKAYTDRNAPKGWTWGCPPIHKHSKEDK